MFPSSVHPHVLDTFRFKSFNLPPLRSLHTRFFAYAIIMGTLSDITSRASNMKRQSNGSMTGSSKAYRSLGSPSEKENRAKTKSPHFMTPTFASKQNTPDPTTPVSPKAKGKPFLRRVGLRRTQTPHPKKESPRKTLSFPDKV